MPQIVAQLQVVEVAGMFEEAEVAGMLGQAGIDRHLSGDSMIVL